MFGKKKKAKKGEAQKIPFKPLNYSPKILIAWGEVISGNREIREFLIKNGYEELGMFYFALKNDNRAKRWLMNNGYPHLNAMIAGGEGDENAISWLQNYGFDVLANMARTIDGDEKAMKWLMKHDPLFAGLAKRMEAVKRVIEADNNDPHKINP